jgi:hypothetical protein
MHKITTFLIGIVVVSLFVTGFLTIMNEDVNNLTNTTYDNSTLYNLSKIDEIRNISVSIEARHKADQTDRGLFDLVGNFIADGIDSIKLTFAGTAAFLSMTDKASDALGLDVSFKSAIFVIVIIIIIIGVIIRIKVGADL